MLSFAVVLDRRTFLLYLGHPNREKIAYAEVANLGPTNN
jgi:hypothetical protein